MQVVNKGIILHPMNWVTVLLMLVIASFAFHQIYAWYSAKHMTAPATAAS